MNKWTHPVPIWVSRENGSSGNSYFEVPLWMFMWIGGVLLLNLLLWSAIGLVVAAQVVIGAFA